MVDFLKVLLVILCIFSLIFLIVYYSKINFDTDVDSVLKLYKSELEKTQSELQLGNKKIDKIEKEIMECKKKLKMSLFINK